MTSLPTTTKKKLGLVVDLDLCVGCQGCAVNCKEWNTGGIGGPMEDRDAQGPDPTGVWYLRVHSYEVTTPEGNETTVHFPKSCLHCEDAPCVTVCPTGASFKREEDGIVLIDPDACMGCKLCSWACPYGAREYDASAGVMRKCTLCIDRIYDETLPEERRVPACVATCPVGARHFGDLADPNSKVSQLAKARQGQALMAEIGCTPVNQFLPKKAQGEGKKSLSYLQEKITSVQQFAAAWASRVKG